MTQKQVDLQKILEEQKDYLECLEATGFSYVNATYSKSVAKVDGIVRKRAKPGYLLKQ